MKKRILSTLLALCMVLSLLPTQVWADSTGETLENVNLLGDIVASGKYGPNLTWTLDSTRTLTISGTGQMEDYSHNGQPWVNYRSSGSGLDIMRVVISDGVTRIGNYAFQFCSYMDSIILPANVTSIGNDAFWGCHDLTNITIPNSVISIGDGAFLDSGLTSVTIPNGVTGIGDSAFADCKNLAKVIIPESVTSIGWGAFESCESLTSVGPIGSGCNIEFGWTTKIPDSVFLGNDNLTSVTIPESIISIGNQAFDECNGLTNAGPIGSNCSIEFGWKTTIPNGAFQRYSSLTSVSIPNGIQNISDNAFSECDNLVHISIPNSVTNIGNYAFKGCNSLAGILIPNSVTVIGSHAFEGCNSLTGITIPPSVHDIKEYSFKDCSGLTSITIPSSVSLIYDYAFQNCNSLTDVYYAGTEAEWKSLNSGIIIPGNSALESATIHYNSTGPTGIPYNVAYVLNGGTGEVPTECYLPGETISVIAQEPTKEGFIFKGWSDGTTIYQSGDTFVMPSQDVALTAVWESTVPLPAGITALYPANGSTFDHTTTGLDKEFHITFDREVTNAGGNRPELDFSVGTLEVHKSSNDSVVYQVTESPFTAGTSSYVGLCGSSAPFTAVSIANITPELDYNTEYYVTMPAGFIKFANGAGSPAIEKGNWTFTTSAKQENPKPSVSLVKPYDGEFWFRSDIVKDSQIGDAERNSLKYPYHYDDSWFFESSLTYQHDLTKMSIRTALAAFDTGTDEPAKNILQLMDDLGFTYTQESIDYPKPSNNTIGYAIGSKNIATSSGESCSLVLVAIRGAGYGAEWGGNFYVGTGDDHAGFGYAASQVMEGLKQYLGSNKSNMCSDIKIWLVGYSRAAATANLVAKQLDNGAIKEISQNNIFAFCFECPQNSIGARFVKSDTKYANIVNIVNPIDFVPKVAMSRWGYGRYGTTYYLPSKEGTKDYKVLKNKMISVYTDILTKNNNGVYPYTPAVYWAEGNGQASILDDFMNNLADEFVSPQNYSYYHEVNLVELAARTLGKENGIIAKIGEYAAFIENLIEIADLGSLVTSHPINTASTVYLFSAKGGYAALAHYPELCLSWIDSLNGAIEGEGYRKIFINCPVNVTVQDSRNQIVAQIDNNVVQEIEDGVVSYIDDDGQKVIILPTNENYTIEMNATNSGIVTYTATEYNFDSASTEKVVSYYEIEVAENDTLVGLVENLEEVPSAQYPLNLNGSDESLTPTVKQSGESVQKFSVEVSRTGNGTVIGGGSYVSGEFAKVTAVANTGETFLGWYVNNTLVSSDAEYRFLVDENVSISAKFTGNTSTTPDVPVNPNPSYPIGGGGYVSSPNGITVPTTVGGTVMVNPKSASKGSTITVTTTPDPGYELTSLTVTDTAGKNIELSNKGNGQYTFTMPNSKVSINAVFQKIGADWNNPFTDVFTSDYYYEAVQWAVANGITNGTNTEGTLFSPNAPCTRAQIVTFLWRAYGKPAPTNTSNKFTDVEAGSYYYDAMLWAVENGITNGTNTEGTKFSPNEPCTRAQAVTFQYRAAKADPMSGSNSFTDVAATDYFANAVQWAVSNGITNGTNVEGTRFSPNNTCTRGQIVTFLYRHMA